MSQVDAPTQVLSGINRCVLAFVVGWIIGAGLGPQMISSIVALG